MNTPTPDQLLRGTIQRITFHNPQSGYSVIKLHLPEKDEQVTVVGFCPQASVGKHLMVRGIFVEHHRYGRQFNASNITEAIPSTKEGIEKYLGSGFIKGIGAKTARKLVQVFGEETLEIICKDPKRVAKVQGVGKQKASLLKEVLSQQKELQEVMRFLMERHITQGLALKIYERLKNKTVEIVSKDPYVLAREIRGIGFATADAIAMNFGLKLDSPQRLKAGLYYALEKATEDGHCFLPKKGLIDNTKLLLGCSSEEDLDLSPFLESLIKEGYLIEEEEAIYLRYLHKAECFVASFIAERLTPMERPVIPLSIVETSIKRAEDELGITLSREQIEAVRSASSYSFLVITGGPGCGKTTIIRALSIMFQEAKKRLSLAAPTGRAAQRMSQVCSMPAKTIHRLLRYDPVQRSFVHGLNEPLLTDALIVDETSMMDIVLARDLLSAIPKDAPLILVGDKDQLPSVGPGKVFGDLISIPEVKTIVLSQLFRRAQESTITTAAHMINAGILPQIPEPDGITKADAYFIPRSNPEEAAVTVEKLVSEQIPKKFGIPTFDIAVLTPTNRGELGAEKLNTRLQAKLNPPSSGDPEQELQIGEFLYRQGDRVCQRVNNYLIDESGVFNGDIGVIHNISRAKKIITVEMWDGRLVDYSPSDAAQLSLGYAMTVHRSQGSEIPCVVLALHDAHYMLLERQLIYTGVTRAKKLLVIVGSKRALLLATKRVRAKRRYSMLTERIKRILG